MLAAGTANAVADHKSPANSEPKSRSRPHVRRFDDSRIGSDLSFHQGVKLSRIYRHRVDAQSRQFFPHITRLQYVESLLMKLLDNGLGCFGGNEHGDPESVIGVGKAGF